MRHHRGEYYHLFPPMRRDPIRFEQYLRIAPALFDYILIKISPHLEKKTVQTS